MSKVSTRKRESNLFVRQPAKGSLSKGWKKKYVIIRQNKGASGKSVLLELYIEKGAHNKAVISLLLEKVDSIARIPSKLHEHAFEIKSGEKNLFCVAAESEIETYEWMEIFHQHLLDPKKEIGRLPDIEDDFCRVSVIPNKDSQRMELEGDYYTVCRDMKVTLYDPYTGQQKIQWDMHHLKKVLVTTKCHFRDKERIMHFVVSSRSEHGKAELHFFCIKARRLADAIFEVLSGNINVKSRVTRSASMIFEITSKDLKKMMKNKDPDAESVASMAIDEPSREEEYERSVQTIPEEMDPEEDKDALAEPNGDQKDTDVNKDAVEENVQQNGAGEHSVEVNGDQAQSPVQVNGHASKDGEETEKVNGDVLEEETPPSDASTERVTPDGKEEEKDGGVVENRDESTGPTATEDQETSVNESKEPEGQQDSQNEIPDGATESSEAPQVPATESDGAIVSGDIPSILITDNEDAPPMTLGSEDVSATTTADSEDVPPTTTVSDNDIPTSSATNEEVPPADVEEASENAVVVEEASENAVVEESQETESPKETIEVEKEHGVNEDSSAINQETNESVPDEKSEDASDNHQGTDETAPTPDKADDNDIVNAAENGESLDKAEPEINSKPDNQPLPHDISTDSGFINDNVETGASINTNNNNSRESLNETMDGDENNENPLSIDGTGNKTGESSSSYSNHEGGSYCSWDAETADVLPEFGLPVDVADLEEISVIVYNEDSPEKLV